MVYLCFSKDLLISKHDQSPVMVIYNLHRKEMNYMTLPEQNFATRFAPFVNERNVMGDVYKRQV